MPAATSDVGGVFLFCFVLFAFVFSFPVCLEFVCYFYAFLSEFEAPQLSIFPHPHRTGFHMLFK